MILHNIRRISIGGGVFDISSRAVRKILTSSSGQGGGELRSQVSCCFAGAVQEKAELWVVLDLLLLVIV